MRPLVALLLLSACAEESLPGDVFNVSVAGVKDNCHSELTPYSESFDYRVTSDASGAYAVYIGPDLLGSGAITGCDFSYGSLIFTDERANGTYVRWSIAGQAVVALGGGTGCEAGEGWLGTETIQINESTDPDVITGCTYVTETTGTWIGKDL
jgi:hypothetical protein